MEIEIPLGVGEAALSYDFEKAVCSHGLFMMSPNHWDPVSRTFSRPLRLPHHYSSSPNLSSSALWVTISHPSHLRHSLLLRVHSTLPLSTHHRQSLLAQVVRMIRSSDADHRNATRFITTFADDSLHDVIRAFGGRVFRSPTLFEDMVKCILLCNCQWPRALQMARALCELQLELQSHPHLSDEESSVSKKPHSPLQTEDIKMIPYTPPANEPCNRKRQISQSSPTHLPGNGHNTNMLHMGSFSLNGNEDAPCGLVSHQKEEFRTLESIGNFPSPEELAGLDEKFLAKRCKLGYRASRIIKLAKGIVEGRIPLRELEQFDNGGSLSDYDKLADQLKKINGIGPFSCANILMCMGFYHVIPADSETIRHLKQVHAKESTIRTLEKDVEKVYGKYAPFQFLAYWAELWHYYGQRFGKPSKIHFSDYKLITASNMRKKNKVSKEAAEAIGEK